MLGLGFGFGVWGLGCRISAEGWALGLGAQMCGSTPASLSLSLQVLSP